MVGTGTLDRIRAGIAVILLVDGRRSGIRSYPSQRLSGQKGPLGSMEDAAHRKTVLTRGRTAWYAMVMLISGVVGLDERCLSPSATRGGSGKSYRRMGS